MPSSALHAPARHAPPALCPRSRPRVRALSRRPPAPRPSELVLGSAPAVPVPLLPGPLPPGCLWLCPCLGACAARRACRASAAPACVRRAPAPAPAVLLLPPLVCVILCSMNTCCVHIHPPAHRAPAAPCRRRLNVGDRLLKAYVLQVCTAARQASPPRALFC